MMELVESLAMFKARARRALTRPWAKSCQGPEHIDAHFTEGFGLITGISRSLRLTRLPTLVRSFKGVRSTPAACEIQQRVTEARRLLLAGLSIVETALSVGFADQSHLTRQFQRIVGASPGRYLKQ